MCKLSLRQLIRMILLLVLTDRARLQHLSESHQDFSVIIIDVSSSAGKAQLFGKMLWVMMAVLEDIHL